jgi:hypothetical protein
MLKKLVNQFMKLFHKHTWIHFMTTGKGDTTANLFRCRCGEEIVKHKGGTFKLDK